MRLIKYFLGGLLLVLFGLVSCRNAYEPPIPKIPKKAAIKTHPSKSGLPRWIFPPPGGATYKGKKIRVERIVSTPKLGTGVVMFSTLDRKIYALDTDGKLKWIYETKGLVVSSPNTDPSGGTVYVGTRDQTFHAIDISTGKSKWKSLLQGNVDSSPLVDSSNSNIYVVANDGHLYTFSPKGKLLWRYTAGASITRSSPVEGFQGTIYFGSADGHLHAVRPRKISATGGSVVNQAVDSTAKHWWKKKVCNKITASVAVDGKTIYVACWDGTLWAVKDKGDRGELKWEKPFKTRINKLSKQHEPILSTPIIDDSGNIFVGTDDKWFYAISTKGKMIWNTRSGHYPCKIKTADKKKPFIFLPPSSCVTGPFRENPVVGTPGYIQAEASPGKGNRVYFGSVNQFFYALNRDSGKIIWQFDSRGWVNHGPVVLSKDGKDVIFVAAGRRLYAINP